MNLKLTINLHDKPVMEMTIEHDKRLVSDVVVYNEQAAYPILKKDQRSYRGLEERLQFALHSKRELPALLEQLQHGHAIAYWYNVNFKLS